MNDELKKVPTERLQPFGRRKTSSPDDNHKDDIMTIDSTSVARAATPSEKSLYLNVTQVADRYSVSTDTIWRWSRNGEMPKPMKLSRGSTRWRMSDLVSHEAGFSVGFMIAFPASPSFFAE